ncbi:Cell wall / vacuolar inhibitor of fructosidase 2 [Morella rubra]|uniref:Cell wall / vacuolar inhibitor of fructosidase 2 n=1 Tax=Morella rubra TaxID=262757 RepID=A0A6A1VUG4_9ROSI|nr:Cell wall / vacuolar inhibitor of fructosidase 2 [Morella rubra]
MASSSVFLSVLCMIFILFCQPFPPAKSDENLIESLCSKTEEPVICSDCLNSDPTSKAADAHALGLIAVRCAEYDATQLYEVVSNLSLNISGGTPFKTVLDGCSEKMLEAKDDFTGVLRSAEAMDYSTAKGIITDQIQPLANWCLDQFDKLPDLLPVPSMVLAGTEAVNQDCKILLGMLDNI